MSNLIEVKALVPVSYADREVFFLNNNGEVRPLIEAIKKHYSSIVFSGIDGATEEGRKELKKLAAELNKKIQEVDQYGKEVVDVLKAKPKQIDAGRKLIKDELTALYQEIRKPVIEFEAEQARIKAEQEAKILEEQRKKDEELTALRLEKEKLEYEKQVTIRAQQKAEYEAQEKVKQAEMALQREREENERKELARLNLEKQKADAEAKKLADAEHVKAIKFKIYNAFLEHGLNKELAKNLVISIADGKVHNLSIQY